MDTMGAFAALSTHLRRCPAVGLTSNGQRQGHQYVSKVK